MKSILVLYGIRGVGKSTLARNLVEAYPKDYFIIKQVTTRPERKDDPFDKEQYDFISDEVYETMIKNKKLTATTIVNGCKYGTPYVRRTDHLNMIGILIVNSDGLYDINKDPKIYRNYPMYVVGLIGGLNKTLNKRNSDNIDKFFVNIENYFKSCNIILTPWANQKFVTVDDLIFNMRTKNKYLFLPMEEKSFDEENRLRNGD